MINPGNLSETLMLQTCKIFLLIRLQMFVIILTLQQFILIKDVGKSYIIKIEFQVVDNWINFKFYDNIWENQKIPQLEQLRDKVKSSGLPLYYFILPSCGWGREDQVYRTTGRLSGHLVTVKWFSVVRERSREQVECGLSCWQHSDGAQS